MVNKRNKREDTEGERLEGPSLDADYVPAFSPQAVADRIGRLRGRASQKAFADELGIHSNTLRRYEQGKRLPDADFLIALARVRRTNPAWLLLGLGSETLSASDPVERVVQGVMDRVSIDSWLSLIEEVRKETSKPLSADDREKLKRALTVVALFRDPTVDEKARQYMFDKVVDRFLYSL